MMQAVGKHGGIVVIILLHTCHQTRVGTWLMLGGGCEACLTSCNNYRVLSLYEYESALGLGLQAADRLSRY